MTKRYKKKRRPIKQSKQNYTKPKLLSRISKGNWGIAIGGILMFVSWVSQNIYISELDAKKNNLVYHSQFMNAEKGAALQWMLKYQEELRKKPNYDPEVIANTAKGYASSMEQILEVAKRVNPKSTILSDHHKNITRDNKEIVKAIESEDVNKIIEISNQLMQWAEGAYDEALPEFRAIEAKMNSSYSLWKKMFKFGYITASSLFAISWLAVNGKPLLRPKK